MGALRVVDAAVDVALHHRVDDAVPGQDVDLPRGLRGTAAGSGQRTEQDEAEAEQATLRYAYVAHT